MALESNSPPSAAPRPEQAGQSETCACSWIGENSKKIFQATGTNYSNVSYLPTASNANVEVARSSEWMATSSSCANAYNSSKTNARWNGFGSFEALRESMDES